MNKERIKVIIAWILLVILILLFCYVNYVKFFGVKINEEFISESPVDNSASAAVEVALQDIVSNFNNNPKIEQYKNEGINLNATLNNYSIYISYTNDKTTTYEFYYNDLNLSTTIIDYEENVIKFNKIYEILIMAVQQRIGNDIDLSEIIDNHLNQNSNYDGLNKEINNNKIRYTMDITKKVK